ncbi:hypothetical protein A2955_04445 [Candidatus Woesebacteria bacterium RIFCSPLOWO2_01_FULL_37_19]|uniref:Uncharacterized protein n=2 Tax=Candidatus Woeseibacteriota TaxID=1752722 RepID=A0A1F8B5A4_9BACT|nr:MAG: hypothetical protein A2771_02285 [Candidatus Woesebacteria bacterium RIFCSPHIGHO2_01_FULL_38_26b]OGM59212.1 MAG: hypothetical protein A2955_04445 [Candidatus Woesebacteria bacterium RIFCSPLOWO2_01_FULL_37_19]
MALLLTEELVREAINLALPSVRELTAKHTWGPKGVAIVVDAKGLSAPFVFVMDELGPRGTWTNRKDEFIDFLQVARMKAQLARRYGSTTSSIIANHPWSLEEGEYLYPGGVAEDTDLGVGASGAYGDTDEACAWVIWNTILLVCKRKIAEMREQGINRL